MISRLKWILGIGGIISRLCIYILLRLPAFFKWLFQRIFVLLTFFIVTLLYTLSLPVPLLGKALLESESRDWMPDFDFRDRVESFRHDMMEIMVRKHSANTGRTRKDLRAEVGFIYLKAKKKHEIGELVVSFWGGVVAVLIGLLNLWPSFSQILSVYVLAITVSILVRIVILDLLAFDRADAKDAMRKGNLELMLGWNKAVLNSIPSQLAILFLGLLGWVHGSSYEVARNALETYVVQGLSKRELLEEIVKEAR